METAEHRMSEGKGSERQKKKERKRERDTVGV